MTTTPRRVVVALGLVSGVHVTVNTPATADRAVTNRQAGTLAPSPTATPPPLTPGNLLVRPWLTGPDPTAVRTAVALAAARAPATPTQRPASARHAPPTAHRARTAPAAPPRRAGVLQRAHRALLGTGERTWPVRPGDTLTAIALATGTSPRAIANHNGITNPDRIYAGTVLRIPGERR